MKMGRTMFLYILIIFGGVSLASGQKCPYNWQSYSATSKCFRFVRATKLTWQDARDYCQTHGGDLLKLESTGERNWVIRQVQNIAKHYQVTGSHWWSGLTNREYLTTWEWADGSPVGNFIPWNPGEPNNRNDEERCAEIVNGNKFNDQACSDQNFFICNRPRGLPLTCDTDRQWQTLNGQCYKVYSQKMSWAGAQAACQKAGANMVTIETSAVESTVHDFASLAKKPIWIGLHSLQVGDGNTWVWGNGSLLTTATYWHDSQPHVADASLNNSCVSVENTLKVAMDWDTDVCTTAKAFVCQKPEGVCFDGWIGHSSNCYQFDPQFRLPYTAAASFCQKQGAQLLRIDSSTDQQFIQSYLDEFRDSDATTIWLGLSDNRNDTGPYIWRNGDVLGKYKYWAYAHNTPINNKGKMDCGYIASTDARGKWRVTTRCDAARAVICRIPMGIPVLPMPATPRPRYGCPPNWQLHKNTCFLVGDTPYDQFSARTQCQKFPGADLAVITTSDMQGFVNKLLKAGQNYYIGLNDKSSEGVFIWNDNGMVTYTNWRPNEPNDWHQQESCVVIYNGAWNDFTCSTKAPYICSMPASNVMPNTLAPTPTTDWTIKCGPGWESNPVSDYCYMFSDQPLIWTDALLQCRDNHGDLAYIQTLEEQSYLAARIKQMSSVAVWIGANDRRTESGWGWSANKGFAYFNWAPGRPAEQRSGKTSDCVAMLTQTAGWDDFICNKRNGFVCKKRGTDAACNNQGGHCQEDRIHCTGGYVSFLCNGHAHRRCCFAKGVGPPIPVTTAVPKGMTWGCGRYWKKWRKSCYAFVNRMSKPVTWHTADTNCRRVGARLASINSQAEQNFIFSNLPRTNKEWTWYWTGLNDLQIENRFQWSDGSDVTYTNWYKGEPNSWHNTEEDCVNIYVRNGKKEAGKWNDSPCDNPYQGYICKRPLYVVPINQTPSPLSIGCKGGSRGYGSYCYKIFRTTPKSWTDANLDCIGANGTLATVNDAYTEAFLSAQLVSYNGNAWIGLSDQDTPGVYTWASKHTLSYTSWDRNHTGNEKSTCIAMRGTPIKGLWSNQDCTTVNGYVCQLPRQGYTPPPTPPTPYPNVACPMGWTENYAYCIKLFNQPSLKKNWMDARTFCQSIGGDLPSFHENGNDSVVPSLTGGKVGVWIGLNDRDTEKGHSWSDGTAVDYTHWNPHEPNDWHRDEDCVELTSGGAWNDLNCYNPHSFLCALPRGTQPITTIAPPQPIQSGQCGAGWIYNNNNCYLFSPMTGGNRTMTWYDSQSYCHDHGATLASIHSQQESSLLTVAAQAYSSSFFWIGLYQSGQKAFQWTDGSPMDFQLWKVNEPNDYYGGEKCGLVDHSTGKWNDQMCSSHYGFICKKPLNGLANIIPAANAPGGCPTGFSRVTGGRNKCFYIVTTVSMNWTNAYAYCRKLGQTVDLASIEDVYENDFVLTMPTNNQHANWIGLSDRRGNNKFYWIDNAPVVYTNWDLNEPTSSKNVGRNKEDCVVQRSQGNGGHGGRWADKDCSLNKTFICQTKQDPNIPIKKPGSGSCHPGYYPFHNGCYKLSSDMLKWTDAEATCLRDGGHLASVDDTYEAAFIVTLAASAAPFWIGLTDLKTPGLYYWSDSSRMVYASWGPREPSWDMGAGKAAGHGCVLSDLDGRWNDTDCTHTYHYVCKISTAIVPPTNAATAGMCLDPTWTIFGDYCYFVDVNNGRSWPEANFACMQRGMTLASMHSQDEFQAVFQMAGSATVKKESFKPNIWLGMSKDASGPYLWSDGTPTNFLSWAPSQPASLGPNGTLQECVEFDRAGATWNTANCMLTRGYACKAKKVYPTTPMPTVPLVIGPDGNPVIQPLSQPGSSGLGGGSGGLSGGGVAGIILGLLLGGLLITFVVIYLRRSGKLDNLSFNSFNRFSSEPSPGAANVQVGFDNNTYSIEKQDDSDI